MRTAIFTAVLALIVSFSAGANKKGENPKTLSEFSSWVNKNISYPKTAIENHEEGTVYIAFSVVEGVIQGIEVVGGVSESLNNEALNTILHAPVAELGLNINENKSYILPVNFALK